MIDPASALTLFMAGVVALAVGVYVVLDGFDLGLGILFFFTDRHEERDRMMNSIAPFWDGNETWLVFGGAVLLAMFPQAFSIIMPAVYLPIIVMLLGLIFRGVAFEFRFKHESRKKVWDLAFAGGSMMAAFSQGVVLGTFLQGVPVRDGRYAGGSWDWLTGFSMMTGCALLVGYALLGAGWIFWRVGGDLQKRAALWMPRLCWLLLAAIAAVSVWTPLMSSSIAARWFDFPRAFAFLPVPLLTAACAWGLLRTARRPTASGWPFAYGIGLFFLSYSGMAISVFPLLPPPSISLFDAAASPSAQSFMLPGVLILVPLILAHTWLNYRVFRDHGDGSAGYGHD
jgi:cytochrome d ubiquinol oxidase subunit II